MAYLILLVSLFFRHPETGFFKTLQQKYFKIAFCQWRKLPDINQPGLTNLPTNFYGS
jgi:hypothetical protein